MRRRLIRTAIVPVGIAGGSALFLVALIGFAHTSAGRPLLGVIGRVLHASHGSAGRACPLGYDRAASPLAREQDRIRFTASHRGQARADSRPALGFDLDRTSRADVLSFMTNHGITCRASTTVADLVCEKVPSQTLRDGFGAKGDAGSVAQLRKQESTDLACRRVA